MLTIHLSNLKFFSFHGLLEEERILGGEFEVAVSLTCKDDKRIAEIQEAVDYVKVYAIIKQQMEIPTPLLETVAQDLAEKIYTGDNRITSVSISIKKTHPPIAAFAGTAGVSYKKDF